LLQQLVLSTVEDRHLMEERWYSAPKNS